MKKMTFLLLAALICHTFACTVPAHSANGINCQTACSTSNIILNAPDMDHPTYDLTNVQASCIDNTAAIGNMVTAACDDDMSLELFQPSSTTPEVAMTDMLTLTCTTNGWQVTIDQVDDTPGFTVLSPPFQFACVLICTNSCPRNEVTPLVADIPTYLLVDDVDRFGGIPTITAGVENEMCKDDKAQSAIGDTYIVDCPDPTLQVPILLTTNQADPVPIKDSLSAGTYVLTCGATGWTNENMVLDGDRNRITCLSCNGNCTAILNPAVLGTTPPVINDAEVESVCEWLDLSIGFHGQTRTIECPPGTSPVINADETIANTLTCVIDDRPYFIGGWASTAIDDGQMSLLVAGSNLRCE